MIGLSRLDMWPDDEPQEENLKEDYDEPTDFE